MWIYLGLLSALFLGLYDIAKKYGVRDNAVIPVLFLSTCFGLLSMAPLFVGSYLFSDLFQQFGLYVSPIEWQLHGLIALKSAIISLAWTLNFFALKHLPLSLVTPIRAAGPFITLFGALFIYGESPTPLQWFGVALILGSLMGFSSLGKKEGIDFRRNRWILFVVLGTIAGSSSGLYDKYLIQTRAIPPQTLQLWFSFYLVTLLGLITLCAWVPIRKKSTPFQWRWSIPLIGILLIAADFVYFRALAHEDALILLLSAVKRSRVFVTLILGAFLFKELNKRKKMSALIALFTGVLLIILGEKHSYFPFL
ncbi:MAG: DMT family transporter [Fibrobacterales bacterium]